MAGSIVGTVLVLLLLLALVIFFVIRSKKTTTGPVVKEEDNPDYGTYYYADGERRQDVMEVNFHLCKLFHFLLLNFYLKCGLSIIFQASDENPYYGSA